jgi:hypothetical protein
MEKIIINTLTQESVKIMINPVIFMNSHDFIEFIKLCEISLGEKPTYKGIKVACDINIKKGVFYITDFITELKL